jgi:ABC-type phosphate transport system ATPase subunit
MVSPVSDRSAGGAAKQPVKLGVAGLRIRYGDHTALQGVTLNVHEHEIFGIIGPANAGKTSFLKAINRMDMFDTNMRVEGQITFNGVDTHRVRNVYGLRRRIGVRRGCAVKKTKPNWMSSSSAACAAPPCGTRSRTVSTRWAACCRVASSND